MTQTNQERIDATRKAAFIEKFSAEYQRSPEFRFCVDNTIYLTDEQIHQSQSLTGTCKELPKRGIYADVYEEDYDDEGDEE